MRLDKSTTLTELLTYVTEIADTNVRALRLREVARQYPGFLVFLRLCFDAQPPMSFKDALAVGPIKPRSINAEDVNGLPVNALVFLETEVQNYSDQHFWKPRVKHAKLLQSLDFMYGPDALLILDALQGKYQSNKRINLLSLKVAFPGVFSVGEAGPL